MQRFLINILTFKILIKLKNLFINFSIQGHEVVVGSTVRHWQGENAMKTRMQNGIYCIIRICLIGNKPHLTQPPRPSMRFSNAEKQFFLFSAFYLFSFWSFYSGRVSSYFPMSDGVRFVCVM